MFNSIPITSHPNKEFLAISISKKASVPNSILFLAPSKSHPNNENMTPIKSQSNKENMCSSSSKKASAIKRRRKAVLQPRNQSVLVGIDGKLALNSPNSTKRKTFECRSEQATKQLFLDMTTKEEKDS